MPLAVACWLLLLAIPSLAAACSAVERADAREAVRIAASLRASAAPTATDVSALVSRARRSCADARFGRAVAAASARFGAPAAGRRVRMLGIDLVGVEAEGATAWRLDAVRLALRVASSGRDREASVLRAHLRAAGSGRAAITWSDDATRPRWDAARQSAVAAALARSPRSVDRRLAGASARAFAAPARQASLRSSSVLEHLLVANRVATAAERSGAPAARSVARSVAVRAHARVRGSRARGWSRLDGRWSTARQHRLLVSRSEALLRRVPHAGTATTVRSLRRSLAIAPAVQFEVLPAGAFYPWPRDAAFDDQSLRIDVDKPGTLTLTVYAADARAVRSLRQDVVPGPVTLTWDGTGSDGTTLGVGDYRYNIDAVDLAGNRVRVPGLDHFRIARDTTPPNVRSASARHVASGGTRRIIAGWDVEEVHSPQVRSWLLLNDGRRRVSIALHDRLARATVRRIVALEPGTWRATYVFRDGSGNRRSHPAGNVVVR